MAYCATLANTCICTGCEVLEEPPTRVDNSVGYSGSNTGSTGLIEQKNREHSSEDIARTNERKHICLGFWYRKRQRKHQKERCARSHRCHDHSLGLRLQLRSPLCKRQRHNEKCLATRNELGIVPSSVSSAAHRLPSTQSRASSIYSNF